MATDNNNHRYSWKRVITGGCLLLVVLFAGWSISQVPVPFFDDDALNRLQQQYGADARQRAVALNQLIKQLEAVPEQQQLQQVNEFFNEFSFAEDSEHWQQEDYWATPEEFVGTRQGDCEDYVIAKYFVLRSLGVPDQKLYLTYVKLTTLNAAHMVLIYFETPQSTPLVLDSYDRRLLPATQRNDLLPVYSFNAQSLFLSNPSAGLGRELPTDKVKNSKWTKLLESIGESKP